MSDWFPTPRMGGGGLSGWAFAAMFYAWALAAGLTVFNLVRCWLWPWS